MENNVTSDDGNKNVPALDIKINLSADTETLGDLEEKHEPVLKLISNTFSIPENDVFAEINGVKSYKYCVFSLYEPNGLECICCQKYTEHSSIVNMSVKFDFKSTHLHGQGTSHEPAMKILKKDHKEKRRLLITNAFLLTTDVTIFLLKIDENEVIKHFKDIYVTFLKFSNNYLKEVNSLIVDVFLPAIQAQEAEMGYMEETDKLNFIDEIMNFCRKIDASASCIHEKVSLSNCAIFEKSVWEFEQLQAAAQTLETLGAFEECTAIWMRQIKKEIQHAELIYIDKEAEGPHSEVKLWKQRMTRFNSLINELKEKDIQATLTVLKLGNSKALELWFDLDRQVTHVYNEARENSKFLQSVEKICVSLYRRNIVEMTNSIGNLTSTLRLIYVYSTYYRSFANMTVLISKISNQMICSCKLYLTNNNTKTIWKQDVDEMVTKMQQCRSLKLAFQDSYRQTKLKMEEDKDEKIFDFSEIQIFGSLNMFILRLEDLMSILTAMKTYKSLHETILEGKESIVDELNKIISNICEKKCDFLDFQNKGFNEDYVTFHKGIDEIHTFLLELIGKLFTKTPNVLSGLRVQQKLDKLIIPNLDHQERYKILFNNFRNEIEDIGLIYMDKKNDPQLERNMPTYAGKMYWSRLLYEKLEEPLLIFQSQANVFSTREGQKIIARYNRVCQTLISYEILNYRSWRKMIRHRVQGIHASILVLSKSEPYPNMYVNFDPDLMGLFREMSCMEKLMCPIPYQVKYIKLMIPTLLKYKMNLHYLVDQYTRLIGKISPDYEKLVSVKFYRLQMSLLPGLTLHDWTSMNIEDFIESNVTMIEQWNAMLDRVENIRVYGIEHIFERISNKVFLSFPPYTGPKSSTYTMQEFSDLTIRQSRQTAIDINSMTQIALESTQEMLNELLTEFDQFMKINGSTTYLTDENTAASQKQISITQSTYDVRLNNKHAANLTRTKKLIHKIVQSSDELVKQFGQKAVEAVIKSIRTSMEDLWKILVCKDAVYALKNSPEVSVISAYNIPKRPIFQVEIRVIGNKFVLKPSIEDIQTVVRQTVIIMQSHSKAIFKWADVGRSVNKSTVVYKAHSMAVPVSLASKASKSEAMVDSDKQDSTLRTDSESSPIKSIGDNDRSTSIHKSRGSMSSLSKVFEKSDSELKELESNCFSDVRSDREIYKLNSFIMAWSTNVKSILFRDNGYIQDIGSILSLVDDFTHLWKIEPEEEIKEFLLDNPSLFEYQNQICELDDLEKNISSMNEYHVVGPFEVHMQNFKIAVINRIIRFKTLYMNACLLAYVSKIEKIQFEIEDIEKAFRRPLTTLDEISYAMTTKKLLWEREINIDMQIISAEEAVSVLSKYNLPLPKDLIDKVEASRSGFIKLIEKSKAVMNSILNIQDRYKKELIFGTELLTKDIREFEINYNQNGPMQPGLDPRDALDKQIFFKNRYDNLNRKAISYNKGELLFGLPLSDFTSLQKIGKELDLLQKLYGLYDEVSKAVTRYLDIPWRLVDMDSITTELRDFQMKCKRLPKGLKEWPAYTELQTTIDVFSAKTPLLEMMTNKAMKPRHWQRMTDLLQYKMDVESDSFNLKNMLDAPLLKEKDNVEDICVSAEREKEIESKLYNVINDWVVQDLKLVTFKARGELLLKGDRIIELQTLLEDSLMILSSLSNNRYNLPFRSIILEWLTKLTNTTEVLDVWLRVQNLWVYLEAVFVGGDIAKQMPTEAKRFQSIDKQWIKIMERAKEVTNAVQCCASDQSMIEVLPRLLDQLELCQKSLSGYLEKKRLCFPRFFFVSDTVLLEILGKASDTHSIQPYLLSIFDNSKTALFNEKHYDVIDGVFSSEKEYLPFDKYVKCEGHVETWLMYLLKEIQVSVFMIIRKSYFSIMESEFELIKFLKRNLAQICILVIQFIWTNDASEALKEARFDNKVMQKTHKNFVFILNTLINETTKELKQYERIKFETLITIHVHQRDIFEELYRNSIRSVHDFEWTKQTRVYFMEELEKCVLSITDVSFEYQNEFLGCTERLVITPLTDRCYITLAQAINMGLGGAPAGPAGTGKTETTKDMGRCLGKYVVVFNCSDQMDFRGLGRIFKGLAQSGSWGCFDEFNRIELPVLSVAAQQIAIILQCKKEGKTKFVFSDGDIVTMNPEFGIFLTMNPGYAGRQELPENLKINFRSLAMMVPDRQIIIRVKLAACGFVENILLARKFFVLYKLCEEQLTKQVHYDFGLRNILSVLRTLGSVRRANPYEAEEKTVMRVLRDMNLSKLVDIDEPLFLSLINDLFPSIILDKAGYPKLEVAVNINVESMDLISHPPWVLKVIQLYETQLVRHGMMTLGPSGSGKSCCIAVLMKSLTRLGQPHKELRMNPKAITASEMFGKLDVATNDWTDGIFSTLWRRTAYSKNNDHYWLILDGPVDAIWIENLNSVLDDNKTLTLANGDRIPMSPLCKIIFEVHNIDNASPATVSRNGMVFMSSSALNWDPIFKGWMKTKTFQNKETIYNTLSNCFPQIFKYTTENLSFKMPILECFIIKQICDILSGQILTDKVTEMHVSRLVTFSIVWSFGAFLELDDRNKLDSFLRSEFLSVLAFPSISKELTTFDYYVKNDGLWNLWERLINEYIYPKDSTPSYSSLLIPNIDNVRIDFLIKIISSQGIGVLLIGEPGTAKTVMINKYASSYNPQHHMFKSLNFSSATTPAIFQRAIESFVDKKVGTTFGPPGGRKMTIFIDDINMPKINEWGDQVANEIVRQTIEVKGIYNLEKPGEFLTILDLQFIAAMIHPGGGRNDIPERLKRHFRIFNCTLPTFASIDRIFSVIGLGHYCVERGFDVNVVTMVSKIVPLTRKLWQTTKNKMKPTPSKFHYIFNLRDLSRIWQGLISTESTVIDSPKKLINLWIHECSRVLSDRFVDQIDLSWFERNFEYCFEDSSISKYADIVKDERVFFAHFMRDAPEVTGEEADDVDLSMPRIYEPVENYDVLRQRLTMFKNQYNEVSRSGSIDMVFFVDAMKHVLKISRVIRMQKGHILLVGVGGSGKQCITKLATFIAEYTCFQITVTRIYNVMNFLEDLKILYRIAGKEGKGVVFLFTDNDIKDESYLEYINNMLASGMIAGLFTKEENDEINSFISYSMKKEFPKEPQTQETLNQYFLDRVRDNLHIVLCVSPIGDKFRRRALYFPALISGCTINWFQKWPKEALISVASHNLDSFSIVCESSVKERIIDIIAMIHEDVHQNCISYFNQFRRSVQITQKSYLSYINLYKSLYHVTKAQVSLLNDRMKNGLEKLKEAQESIIGLSTELEQKEKNLLVASTEAEAVLANVTKQTTAAESVKNKVRLVKDKCAAIVEKINFEHRAADIKLRAAQPALQEAEEALNTIRPADISTVRKLQKPPHLIQRIMDCVLILYQKKINPYIPDHEKKMLKTSWQESLKLLASTNFLNSLLNFPRDLINEEIIDLLQPYFLAPDYNLEAAKKSCGNVAGLCGWTKAMEKFYWVNREVIPLKDNLLKQEIILVKANDDLHAAENILIEKEQILLVVKAEYDAAMKRKKALEDDASACRKKMSTAKQLMNGLKDEKSRWTIQSHEFENQIGLLAGDIVVLSAFVSYCGPFNQQFRMKLTSGWLNLIQRYSVPVSKTIDVIDRLSNPNTVSEWNLQGLPNDKLSVENAIIVTSSSRFSLLVDPQSQGKHWIRKKESAREIMTTTLSNKYFQHHLEEAMTNGNPIIIEDINEELDSALNNVLEKNFIKIGTGLKVKVGDKEVNMHKNFNLYITTKLSNPHFSPEIYAKMTVIDFSVTIKGLEDQLLGLVINIEKEELEKSRNLLLKETSANKRKVKDLEDNLLERLANTEGSLVEDQNLLIVLSKAKQTSLDVSKQIYLALESEREINQAREEYRPVAKRGSLLYFIMTDLSNVNSMYQNGLKQFLNLFVMSINQAEQSPFVHRRISHIVSCMTINIWNFVVRSLYKIDRSTFTLLLALKIDMENHSLRPEELNVLLKGGSALDLKAVDPKPIKWIVDMTWLNLVALSKLHVFSGLLEQIISFEKLWKNWFDTEAPEDEDIPCGYNEILDDFKKLLLIRCWCPDRTLIVAKRYISMTLGDHYVGDTMFNIEALSQEADNQTPLLGLLSLGADPTPLIEHYAKKHHIELSTLSMGQGQEVHARRIVIHARSEGNWVLLQNCHLCLDYINELFMVINETTHVVPSFRLWMTTEEHSLFPINFLQISIKFTNEPPEGIKANLQRTFADVTQDYLDCSVTNHWKVMFYALAFLHCTVQERRKYGPLGWNIPYEFNQADFNACNTFMQNHLDGIAFKKSQKTSGIDWKCVRYMISEIQYGGRVTDDFDLRLLMIITKWYFQEAMFLPDFKLNPFQKIVVYNYVDDYKFYISNLSTTDNPGSFGLHTNADISYSTKTTKRILETILSMQPKDSHQGAGETRESIVYKQCTEMLEKVPMNHNPYKIQERISKMGALQPMNIFLRQEIDRIDKVITNVRSTLNDLKLAIDGVVVMNDDLREALDSMFDAKIPKIWEKTSWESTTLGFWFTELIDRNNQFLKWLNDGRPLAFWITGFFNPQGFLTAMRQEITRSHEGWSLDSVVLSSRVTRLYSEELKESPKEGVFIYGLFLEGASWDKRNGRLVEAKPKLLYDSMPIINTFAIQESAKKKPEDESKIYISPVYKKPKRTNLTYITNIELACSKTNEHWIMRGVTLLCDIK